MTGHRMGETLEGLFERRCAESGVSFEEEARELRIPATALREKLSGRDGFKKAEAERVCNFLRPAPTNQNVELWLIKLGPYAARKIDANLRREEYLRLARLPEEEREAEFQRDPGLREDFDGYPGELDEAERETLKEKIREKGPELRPLDGEARRREMEELDSLIKDMLKEYQQEVAFRAGETLERLVNEKMRKYPSWRPKSDFLELSGLKPDKFAKVEKGKADIRLDEIARCSFALGVSPSVVIGDVTEEEWRIVEQLRGMGDSDRELVKSLIERLASGPTEGQ